MRPVKFLSLVSFVLLAYHLGAGHAAARPGGGGEDWPFYCSMPDQGEHGVDAFKVVSDDGSASGFALKLYSGDDVVAYIPADVQESDDHHYYQIYGREDNYRFLRDRQLLAYVAKEDGGSSMGDVKVTLHEANGDFDPNEMKPITCRAF